MEEERERQSLDSSRPSTESMRSVRTNERSEPNSNVLSSSGRRDESTDGTRLRLEPVKERKSEYGIDGYNAEDQDTPKGPVLALQPHLSDAEQAEAGKIRSHSTSPQLPSMNRMSGFGIDLFAKPKESVPEAPTIEEPKRISTTSLDTRTEPAPASNPEQTLSPGFKSVVSQAFERKTDSSLPPTPVSQPNSAVRTGRDRAGTIGISPIMSGVPNASDVQGNNEQSTSVTAAGSASDALTDHVEPENSSEPPTHSYQAYKPPQSTSSNEQSAYSQSNNAATQPPEFNDEPLQPPRPTVGRDESFRPHLPGGWSSFATTPGSEVPAGSSSEAQASTVKPVTSRSGTPVSTDVSKDTELTPTATKYPVEHSLSSTATGQVEPHRSRSSSPSKAAGERLAPEQPTSNAAITPDHTMAPSGSLYSHTALDPRLLPKLERVSPEAQLRPDVVKPSSSSSDQAPTPLPKDTPIITDDNPGYFPQKAVATSHSTLSEPRTSVPQISQPDEATEAQYTDPNDHLHDEIVRGLSPKPVIQRVDSLGVDSSDEKAINQSRISSYLPSEYDNYWASTAEEEMPAAVVTAPPQDTGDRFIQAIEPAAALAPNLSETPLPTDRELTPEPLSPRKTEQGPFKRLSTPHRYSWEAKSENGTTPAILGESYVPTEASEHDTDSKPEDHNEQDAPASTPAAHEGLKSHPTIADPESHSEGFTGRDAALIGGGLAMGGVAAASYNQPVQTQQLSDKLSLAEEKTPEVSSYPVSSEPAEDEHPSRSPQPYSPQSADGRPEDTNVSNVSAPSAPSSSIAASFPTQTQTQQSVTILPFKEIAAMPLPSQRIHNYDETRQKFATMDSGLSTWISNLQSQYPEHSEVTGSFGRTTLDQSKFGKQTGGPSPPLQQPYYQQYLNASSPTTPGTPTNRPGPATPVGTQHGFSPAAGITTQQVQAKGKELLHTAGVFGGKAGKVGKGLLAKGKNKLRGAGGGDKVD